MLSKLDLEPKCQDNSRNQDNDLGNKKHATKEKFEQGDLHPTGGGGVDIIRLHAIC